MQCFYRTVALNVYSDQMNHAGYLALNTGGGNQTEELKHSGADGGTEGLIIAQGSRVSKEQGLRDRVHV